MKKIKLNKDFKKGIFQTLGMFLVFLIFTPIIIFGIKAYNDWNIQRIFGEITNSDIDDNTVNSQARERFYLSTPLRNAEFFLEVETTDNKTWTLGKFEMDYKLVKDLGSGRKQVNVIYQVPVTWLIEEGIDFNVSAEFKMKNPPIETEARRDPTFYRGKDYPDIIPFEEIEITTDFVTQYIDTGETEYDFVIRVSEESDDFNIRELRLLTPEYVEVSKR